MRQNKEILLIKSSSEHQAPIFVANRTRANQLYSKAMELYNKKIIKKKMPYPMFPKSVYVSNREKEREFWLAKAIKELRYHNKNNMWKLIS